MNAVVKFPVPAAPSVGALVDDLGRLQAQIAELQKAEKALKDAIKTEATGTLAVGGSVKIEGSLFSATIIETDAIKGLDPKVVEARLREVIGSDNPFFTDPANIKVTRAGSITIKMAARKTVA